MFMFMSCFVKKNKSPLYCISIIHSFKFIFSENERNKRKKIVKYFSRFSKKKSMKILSQRGLAGKQYFEVVIFTL